MKRRDVNKLIGLGAFGTAVAGAFHFSSLLNSSDSNFSNWLLVSSLNTPPQMGENGYFSSVHSVLKAFNISTQESFFLEIPCWGHSWFQSKVNPNIVATCEQYSFAGCIVDLKTRKILRKLTAPAGSMFLGHGLFSADGKKVIFSQGDLKSKKGYLAFYDVEDNFKLLERVSSGGFLPHEISQWNNALWVANQGEKEGSINKSTLTRISLDGKKILKNYQIPYAKHFIKINEYDVVFTGVLNNRQSPQAFHLNTQTEKVTIYPMDGSPHHPSAKLGEALSIVCVNDHTVAFTVVESKKIIIWDIKSDIAREIKVEKLFPTGLQIFNNELYVNASYGRRKSVSYILKVNPNTLKISSPLHKDLTGNGRHSLITNS